MKYREIKELTKTSEFLDFIFKNNLVYYNKNSQIIVKSQSFTMVVYSFYVEKNIYFDFYINDCQQYSNIDRLLSNVEKKNILDVLNYYQSTHLIPFTNVILPNNFNNTLNSEQFFLTYIKLLDLYLKNFLEGNINEYIIYFSSVSSAEQIILKELINNESINDV